MIHSGVRILTNWRAHPKLRQSKHPAEIFHEDHWCLPENNTVDLRGLVNMEDIDIQRIRHAQTRNHFSNHEWISDGCDGCGTSSGTAVVGHCGETSLMAVDIDRHRHDDSVRHNSVWTARRNQLD